MAVPDYNINLAFDLSCFIYLIDHVIVIFTKDYINNHLNIFNMNLKIKEEENVKNVWGEDAPQILQLLKERKGNPKHLFNEDGSLAKSKEWIEDFLQLTSWQKVLKELPYETLLEAEEYISELIKEKKEPYLDEVELQRQRLDQILIKAGRKKV